MAGVLGLLAAPLFAADDNAAKADRPLQQLTAEQRAAAKALIEKFHADMKPLRANVKTAVEKLKELRQSGAGQDERQAQREVVKSRIEAVKARWEQFKTDLKAAVPAEVYEKLVARFHAQMKEFLEEHPTLKERIEEHKKGETGGAGS
jgi:tryptophan 2,3-dioxygenase